MTGRRTVKEEDKTRRKKKILHFIKVTRRMRMHQAH
jgi:hypothetical protein